MSDTKTIGDWLDLAATVAGFASSALLMAGAIKALGWKKLEEAAAPSAPTPTPAPKGSAAHIAVVILDATTSQLKEIGKIERKLIYPGFLLLVFSFGLSFVQKVWFA